MGLNDTIVAFIESIKILSKSECTYIAIIIAILVALKPAWVFGTASDIQDIQSSHNQSNPGNTTPKRFILNFNETTLDKVRYVKSILD
jgi:hypothetical protein